MNRLLLSALVLLVCGVPLFSQSFSPNIRINDDAAGKLQASPQVRVDRQGRIYVVWTDMRSNAKGDLYLSRSTDRGATFSANVPVYTGGSSPSGFQEGAQIAIDEKGWVHLVRLEQQGDYDVFYSRSTDGGTTFSEPMRITADSGRHMQDYPSIAVDSSGNIYVAWVDGRELANGLSTTDQIYFTKSTDGGTTFTPPIRASNMPDGVGGSCECCGTGIAVSPEGNVYIALRSNIDNRRDIFIARSMDGGASFATAIPAASEEWTIFACPTTGPSIALDRNENLHVTWRDSRQASGGKSIVYYAQLRHGDESCLPDTKLSTSGKSDYPSISLTPEGAIICAWQDAGVDANDVLYVYSFDGGNSFTPAAKPSDETKASRQMLASTAIGPDGTRYAVWQDTRNDAGDIMFARDTTELAVILPGSVRPQLPMDGAQLQTFDAFLWSPPENLSSGANILYDLTYETGGERTTVSGIRNGFHGVALAKGDYRWWVTARTTIGISPGADTMSFTLLNSSSVPVEGGAQSDVNIRPNVVRGGEEVHLLLPRQSALPVMVRLYDASGNEVATFAGSSGRELRLNLPTLAAGIYRVVVRSVGQLVSLPLVVLR